MVRSSLHLCLLASLITLLVGPAIARVKVDVQFDEQFDFASVKTWGWNPAGAGEVKMARTKDDDPDNVKSRAEPWILSSVASEMPKRGLQLSSSSPDVALTYYLLISTTMNSQVMGQFLPGSVSWGLPPFLASTQSFEVMNQGALVIDMSAAGKVVWRGVAQAQYKLDIDEKRRESLLREAVRDLLRRFPPKG